MVQNHHPKLDLPFSNLTNIDYIFIISHSIHHIQLLLVSFLIETLLFQNNYKNGYEPPVITLLPNEICLIFNFDIHIYVCVCN